MFESLISFFAILLILCGLFFVFYLLISKSLSDRGDGFFVCVEGYEENEKLPCQVYSAFIQINMMHFGTKRDVYVIDYNLKESTRDLIKEAIAPYGKVIFLKCEDNKLKKDIT